MSCLFYQSIMYTLRYSDPGSLKNLYVVHNIVKNLSSHKEPDYPLKNPKVPQRTLMVPSGTFKNPFS